MATKVLETTKRSDQPCPAPASSLIKSDHSITIYSSSSSSPSSLDSNKEKISTVRKSSSKCEISSTSRSELELPCLVRDKSPPATQNQPQVPLPYLVRGNSPPAIQNQPQVPHSVIKLLRDLELGKHIIVLIVPMTTLLITIYNPDSTRLVESLIIICLCIGFAATWNGILLREMFPRTANALEQLGVAFIFLAFFGLVSSSLPATLVWVPGLCWALSLLPFVLAFFSSRGVFKN